MREERKEGRKENKKGKSITKGTGGRKKEWDEEGSTEREEGEGGKGRIEGHR